MRSNSNRAGAQQQCGPGDGAAGAGEASGARALGALLATRKFDTQDLHRARLGSAPVDGRAEDEDEGTGWDKSRQARRPLGAPDASPRARTGTRGAERAPGAGAFCARVRGPREGVPAGSAAVPHPRGPRGPPPAPRHHLDVGRPALRRAIWHPAFRRQGAARAAPALAPRAPARRGADARRPRVRRARSSASARIGCRLTHRTSTSCPATVRAAHRGAPRPAPPPDRADAAGGGQAMTRARWTSSWTG